MELDIERLWQFKLSGYCCSQMIIAMDWKQKDKNRPYSSDLGLCNRLYSGLLCSALQAVQLVFIHVGFGKGSRNYDSELTNGFQEAYGTVNCEQS